MPEPRKHAYDVEVRWTGNLGAGTANLAAYSRDHDLAAAGKPPIACSSDPAFRGDASRYNPEDLLVGSLSACHMLWFLALCAQAKITVVEYVDRASGSMLETAGGGGAFEEVVLRPAVTLAPGSDPAAAAALHERAHALCFISNSVNFPVRCEPAIRVGDAPDRAP